MIYKELKEASPFHPLSAYHVDLQSRINFFTEEGNEEDCFGNNCPLENCQIILNKRLKRSLHHLQ